MSRVEFEQRTRDGVLVIEALRQIVNDKVKVSPEEIKSFYETNITRFREPEMVRASHILVRVTPDASEEVKKAKKVEINAARALVVNGEKFADIARKVSEDPGSARNGGDLNFFPRGAMMPEFERAAFALQTNQVSEVITTSFGYHILLVTDRKAAKQLSLDDVKADIEQFLRSRKGSEVVHEHIKTLRSKAKVAVLLPALTPLPSVVNTNAAPVVVPKP